MNKTTISVAAVSAILVMSSPSLADDPRGISSTVAVFPAVTVACMPFEIPEDSKVAKKAIDAKRLEWLSVALNAGLKKSGYPFVDAKIEPPPEDSVATDKTIDGSICAVVEKTVGAVTGMTVHKWAKRAGTAGYCIGTNVEVCLRQAFKESGFTDKQPWPRLPVYARWQDDSTNPIDVVGVIAALSTPSIKVPNKPEGGQPTYEKDSVGLKPVVPCQGDGDPLCSTGGKPVEIDSARVGWFIEALPPPPPLPPPPSPPKAQ